jgi:hypothetical protein
MKQLFSFFLFGLVSLSAQNTFQVVHSQSKKPVPYANIWLTENNFGTSTNQNGFFELPNISQTDTLVIDVVGFQKRLIVTNQISNPIELFPIIEINELMHIPKVKILQKNTTFQYQQVYLNPGKPYMFSKLFPNKDLQKNGTKLKKVRVKLNNRQAKSKFLMRFYEVDENSKPSKLLHQSPILVEVRESNVLEIEVDVKNIGIIIPKNGILVALETIVIPENKLEWNATEYGTDKTIQMVEYQPNFSFVPTNSTNTWLYSNGKWNLFHQKNQLMDGEAYPYVQIDVSISVTK